jgi:hypothetical protein
MLNLRYRRHRNSEMAVTEWAYKVVQGYEEQLETYKAAAQTEEALFLIIDVGKMGTKLTKIKKIQQERQASGERAADIVVVDAKRKPSASNR